MKVLFVSSGNTGAVGVIVQNQGESLKKLDIEVDYYVIEGKGFLGYVKNILKIRRKFKSAKYDLIHAHYSFSGFAAALTGCSPIVTSLMGSDTYQSPFLRIITNLFIVIFWDRTVVKTDKMQDMLSKKSIVVMPNGVDLDRFQPMDKHQVRQELNLPKNNRIVIFLANPAREEKNYDLAQRAVSSLNDPTVILLPVFNVPNSLIPKYLNAADVLLLTSKWEGSVNVVKEAMACNTPVISTDVGDVRNNLKGVTNSYVCSHNYEELAIRLKEVLDSPIRTNGRECLIRIGLDSNSVAQKILQTYRDVVRSEM